MRRTLVTLTLAVALAAPAFGQFAPTSLENTYSGGLFYNEIDNAFQGNVDFGTFDQDFLFGGLGNPLQISTNLSGSSFTLGYYLSGAIPVSLYATGYAYGLQYRTISGTQTADTLNTTWLASHSVTTPTAPVYINRWNVGIQGLTRFGPAVVGLFFSIDTRNSDSDVSGADTYFQSVANTYYVDAGGAIDYTSATSATNINGSSGTLATDVNGSYTFTDTMQFGVPFAIATGSIEHTGYVDVNIASTDQSGSYTKTESAHAVALTIAKIINDVNLSIVSKYVNTDIKALYELTLPISGSDDQWVAIANITAGINTRTYTKSYSSIPFDINTDGTKTQRVSGKTSSDSKTYATGLDLGLVITGGRLFSFKPASTIEFKVKPMVGLGFGTLTNGGDAGLVAENTSAVTYDAAGVATTTIMSVSSFEPAKSMTVSLAPALYTGLEISPDKWPFSIIMGATPQFSVTSEFGTTASSSTITTSTIGAVITQSTTTTSAKTTLDFDYSFSEQHYLGISIPFDGGVRFDAYLSGSLLEFSSYKIQAFIPLGTKSGNAKLTPAEQAVLSAQPAASLIAPAAAPAPAPAAKPLAKPAATTPAKKP